MIMITGMHRSGTSLIANLLCELGMNFGDKSLFLSTDKWNEKGYYENKEMLMMNNSLILGDFIDQKYWTIESHKRNIFMNAAMVVAQARYLLFPSKENIVKRAEKKDEQIRELAQKYNNCIIKDPRFSLTIGEWAKRTAIKKVLYCYRDPFEVAMSLKKRNHAPLWLCYKMWHHHVKEFFDQAKGIKLVMIDYNALFDKEKVKVEIKRLYNFMEKKYDEKEASSICANIIETRLKHNIRQNEKIPLNVQRLYAQLQIYHRQYSDIKPFQEP